MWRDTRCVIVTAPGYIPELSFANNNKPTHTEEVEKGSSTEFQVGLGHRFNQKVAAKITATLDGKESLDPDHLDTAPGQLTYVAPNEDGQDGIVQLESVSKQGIGRLKLTFHTGTKKLKVSIDGTMTTSAFGVSYTTTVHAKDIILSQMATSPQISPDGLTQTVTFSGGGPATAEIRIKIADCPKPYTQKGTLQLFADHEFNDVTNLDLRLVRLLGPGLDVQDDRRLVRRPAARFVHRHERRRPRRRVHDRARDGAAPAQGRREACPADEGAGQVDERIDATVTGEIISEGK